jgi:hypothetical protein
MNQTEPGAPKVYPKRTARYGPFVSAIAVHLDVKGPMKLRLTPILWGEQRVAEFLLTMATWFVPTIGAWILSQLPIVRNWAQKNWTKSVIIVTIIASYSFMGFGFYVYYRYIAPYVVICTEANACISVTKKEIESLQEASNNAVKEADLIYSEPSKSGAHTKFTWDWAHRTNNEMKKISSRFDIK